MEFRQITSDQDWSDAANLRNKFFWNSPLDPEEMKSFFEMNVNQGRPEVRELLHVDGEAIAFGGASQNASAQGGQDFWLRLAVDPNRADCAELFQTILQRSIETAKGLGAETVRHETRSEYPWTVAILEKHGFEFSMRFPLSALSVQEVSYPPIGLPLGHQIVNIIEYESMFPETWEHDLWRIEMDVAVDLPLPFPFEESPFEDYREELHDPLLSRESQFVYLVDNQIAGTTQLHPTRVDSRYAVNGLTGTRRQFRRQKVAMHLKQTSAIWAKAQGIEQIFTDNEENNPMYQLNLQLGFKHLFDNLVFSRSI
jgi:GNAT superfamily N-acetyltransferase